MKFIIPVLLIIGSARCFMLSYQLSDGGNMPLVALAYAILGCVGCYFLTFKSSRLWS